MKQPHRERSIAGKTLSVTTIAAVVLYALGTSYFQGFYSVFGLAPGLVSIPLYTLLMPAPPVAFMLYHVAVTFISLAGLHLFRTPGEVKTALDQPRWAGRTEVVLGVAATVMFWGNAIIWWNKYTSSILFGSAIGVLLWVTTKLVAPGLRVMLVALGFIGLCLFARFYGDRDARVYRAPLVEYWTGRSGDRSEHGRLLTYDGRNYFVLETAGTGVTMVNADDVRAMRFEGH